MSEEEPPHAARDNTIAEVSASAVIFFIIISPHIISKNVTSLYYQSTILKSTKTCYLLSFLIKIQ